MVSWEESQEKYLKKLYCEDGLDFTSIAQKLNKSVDAVKSKVLRLKLKKRPRWLPIEVEILEELVGEIPLKNIPRIYNSRAAKLGYPQRTHSAIAQKASNLRCRRKNKTGGEWFTSADVADGLGISPCTVREWFERHESILKPVALWKSNHKVVVSKYSLRKFFKQNSGLLERYKKRLNMVWLVDILC